MCSSPWFQSTIRLYRPASICVSGNAGALGIARGRHKGTHCSGGRGTNLPFPQERKPAGKVAIVSWILKKTTGKKSYCIVSAAGSGKGDGWDRAPVGLGAVQGEPGTPSHAGSSVATCYTIPKPSKPLPKPTLKARLESATC